MIQTLTNEMYVSRFLEFYNQFIIMKWHQMSPGVNIIKLIFGGNIHFPKIKK